MGVPCNTGVEKRSPYRLKVYQSYIATKRQLKAQATQGISTNVPYIPYVFRRLMSLLGEFMLIDKSYFNVILIEHRGRTEREQGGQDSPTNALTAPS